jgi:arylsulfatase A
MKLVPLLFLVQISFLMSCVDNSKPNIIFILADDLGYGDLGCYGQEVIKTPSIDKLASDGMRFTQAYAGSTVCAPSRCVLMTGYHTGKAYIRNNGAIATGERINLPESTVTVAKILQENGYVTGLFGKWGLGEPETEGIPNKQGFSEFYGFLNQGHAHRFYVDHAWYNTEKVFFPENEQDKEVTNVAEWYFGKLKDFIRGNKDRPFFIYYATQLPHAELRAPEQDMKQYLTNGKSIFHEIPFEGRGNYRATDMPFATYAAMVSQLDRHVSEINGLLEELGIDKNTIIIFTSDNGPHREGGYFPETFNSSGGLRGIKRDLYEGGIRVPMIVKWPRKIKAGSTSNYPWAFWDFLPTVTDLLGVKPPAGLDGVSSLPVWKGIEMDRPNPLYWEFILPNNQVRIAIRDGKWKGVIYGLQSNLQLFDLEEDPFESKNLASEHAEIVDDLKRKIREARTPSKFWPVDEVQLEKVLTTTHQKSATSGAGN